MRFYRKSSQTSIFEATRLVSAGRSGEATAILQRSLGIAVPKMPIEPRSWHLPNGVQEWFGQVTPSTRSKPAVEPEKNRGQFLSRSYSNAAGMRGYWLYVPSGYRGEPVPLVVMLHGCKQSPEDFATGTRMNLHAEERTWLVAYPEQSSMANGSRCWNWFRPEDQQRGKGEPSLIAGITQQVMNDMTVDAARVYVAGLSAGGAAAAIMGLTYADLYAGVGIHSGLAPGAAHDMPSAFAAMRRAAPVRQSTRATSIMPTIVFHGDHDRTVNPQNAELILEQLNPGEKLEKRAERGQVPGGYAYTRTRYIDRVGSVLLESWMVHGEAHAWSGGSRDGFYTDPSGPDASREIIRFFSNHSRRGPG